MPSLSLASSRFRRGCSIGLSFILGPLVEKAGASSNLPDRAPVLVAFGALLFRARGQLLGADLGMHWGLIVIAVVMYGVSIWIAFQHSRHLSITTMLGVPELLPAGQQKGKLLKDGTYHVVRHPRYLSAGSEQ